jgi:hypothetical protein
MSIEAMKLALEALEHEAEVGNDNAYLVERNALRAAIEQGTGIRWDASAPVVMQPHPAFQKRQWQGLTDEEIIKVIHPLVIADIADEATDYEIARAIEAKLKEKNT